MDMKTIAKTLIEYNYKNLDIPKSRIDNEIHDFQTCLVELHYMHCIGYPLFERRNGVLRVKGELENSGSYRFAESIYIFSKHRLGIDIPSKEIYNIKKTINKLNNFLSAYDNYFKCGNILKDKINKTDLLYNWFVD